MKWDGMGWDGMGWDGMGWDGMPWRTLSAVRRAVLSLSASAPGAVSTSIAAGTVITARRHGRMEQCCRHLETCLRRRRGCHMGGGR